MKKKIAMVAAFAIALCGMPVFTLAKDIQPVPAEVSTDSVRDMQMYAGAQSMGADTTEITDVLDNPERGFYSSMYLYGQQSGNTAQTSDKRLVHLRVGLGNFSHNYLKSVGQTPDDFVTGGYIPLSDDFLLALDHTMENLRQNGASVILRFAYDQFDGTGEMEPSMDGVLAHIEQLTPFFEKNADVILAVEGGFLGCWGEQHGSSIVTPDNIAALSDALLSAVPAPLTVSMRRPLYYAYAADVDMENIDSHKADKSSPYYRLGIYNDGYLGSESDRGTYVNREKEVAWLEYQGEHTLFGGEVASNYSTDGTVYNDIEYACEEMFRTHTSYLNREWNRSVLDKWEQDTYTGPDEMYAGKSALLYVENHMGYRFVLRQSAYDPNAQSIYLQVENVGAGNLLKPKTTELILVDSRQEVYKIPTVLNPLEWKSCTVSQNSIQLPEELASGEYSAYLRIRDQNGNQIQFANQNPFTEYGNYIGSFCKDEMVLPSPTTPPQENCGEHVDENGVWHIDCEESLQQFAQLVNKGQTDLCAVLERSLCLQDTAVPIGNADEPYTGTFDGNGCTIENVRIQSSQDRVGFFGYVGQGGTVKNLSIASGEIEGNNYVGAVVGYLRGRVEACNSAADVKAAYRAGGIVGYSDGGTVTDCAFAGTVNASDSAAGIAAYNKEGVVSDCVNEGRITAETRAAGIAADNKGNIRSCVNKGSVTAERKAGGIFADSEDALVEVCVNGGNVSAQEQAGGIGACLDSGSISDCENSGVVYAGYRAGGISAYTKGKIENCLNSAEIKADWEAGGITAYNNEGNILYCRNTQQVSGGKENAGGIVGKNKGQIQECVNSGPVNADTNAGGVAGYHHTGQITDCQNTGSVEGEYRTGGVSGYNLDEIIRCTNDAQVQGKDTAGGIVGYNYGGKVDSSGNNGPITGEYRCGGVAGYLNGGELFAGTSTGNVSGNSYVGGVAGRTAAKFTLSECTYRAGTALFGIGANDPTQGEDIPGQATKFE